MKIHKKTRLQRTLSIGLKILLCGGLIIPLVVSSSTPHLVANALSPSTQSITQSAFTTDTILHDITMPAQVSAGDLLLVLLTNDGGATVTTPSGWTQLWTVASGTTHRSSGYAKVALGNEAGAKINFATSAAEQAAAQTYRITSWEGSLNGIAIGSPAISTDAAPGGTTAQPPTVTAPWGAADTLWIATTHTSTSRTITSGPVSFSSVTSTRSGNDTAAGQLGSASRSTTSATESPGIFTFSGTGVASISQTIGIAPSNAKLAKALEKFSITNQGTTLWVPFYVSQKTTQTDPTIRRAIVVIHGQSRNAIDYFDYATESLGGAKDIITVAPQFATINDSPSAGQLYWGSGWSECNRSVVELPWRLSSCEVLDRYITHLYSTFTNLDSIVIVGNSAGGQLTNRYAAAHNDIRNRYIVSAPSSYLYLSPERWNSNAGSFAQPITSCSTYNDYKFGLNALSATNYMFLLGTKVLTDNYRNARVLYVIGSDDNDPLDPALDIGCEAMEQGTQRLSRMQNFYTYLGYFYGQQIYQRHTFAVVPGYAHAAREVIRSAPVRTAMLEGSTVQSPTEMSQSEYGTTVAIPLTKNTTSSTVTLQASAINKSTESSTPVQFYFEVRRINSNFANIASPSVPSSCSSGTRWNDCVSKIWSTSANAIVNKTTGSIAIAGLDIGQYAWQAKACDSNNICSSWAEPSPEAFHFSLVAPPVVDTPTDSTIPGNHGNNDTPPTNTVPAAHDPIGVTPAPSTEVKAPDTGGIHTARDVAVTTGDTPPTERSYANSPVPKNNARSSNIPTTQTPIEISSPWVWFGVGVLALTGGTAATIAMRRKL